MRHGGCSPGCLVLHSQSLFTRGLKFLEPTAGFADAASLPAGGGPAHDIVHAHARSAFRSLANPRRFALYSLAETPPTDAVVVRLDAHDHTLMVVREFRRVPLYASALSLTLFTARPGRASEAVATVAHFVERAVSVWEPSYVMLAQSLEQPRLSVLLTGVHQSRALAGARRGAFSLDALLSELSPMLADAPEIFEYCREERAAQADEALVSPHAV